MNILLYIIFYYILSEKVILLYNSLVETNKIKVLNLFEFGSWQSWIPYSNATFTYLILRTEAFFELYF